MTLYQKLNNTIINCFAEARLEDELNAIQKVSEMSEELYKSLLIKNLQIHKSIESQIENKLKRISKTPLHDFFHSRLDWLCRDLKEVGIADPMSLPIDFLPPQYSTLSTMLGGWYLLEGSMLGNRMIYNWLRKHPQLAHIDELYFYKNYDKNVGRRWRTFHQLIEMYADNHEESIVAAKDTFRFFGKVMKGHQSNSQLVKVA